MRPDISVWKWNEKYRFTKDELFDIVKAKMLLAKAKHGYNSENYAYWFNKMLEVKDMMRR